MSLIGHNFFAIRKSVSHNILWIMAFVAFSILLFDFFCGLHLSTSSSEVAEALGCLLGGVIGAGGAVWAVFLALSSQKNEDAEKVNNAVRIEITAFVKHIIGVIEMCIKIKDGLKIPSLHANGITRALFEPTIYPAIADKIGLLSNPEATVEFYTRIAEAKIMSEAFQRKTEIETQLPSAVNVSLPRDFVTSQNAAGIVDCLVTALHCARIIITNNDICHKSQLGASVQQITLNDIDECLSLAKISFPGIDSFKTAP